MTNPTHAIQWDDQRVARFWDFASGSPAFRDVYFSKLVGPGIVSFLRRIHPMKGCALDYGCGPGFLIEQFLKAGIACEGVDFSPDSVAAVNRRFAADPNWKGAQITKGTRLPHPDGSFDLVVCLETVEHVLAQHMDPLLEELRRVLKPGTGRLLITTPNAEDLSRAEVSCPDCGSVFHRLQHVRTFDAQSLRRLMEEHGFQTIACNATDFERFQMKLWPGIMDINLRRMGRMARSGIGRLFDALHIPGAPFAGWWAGQYLGKGQNLFWYGNRPDS